MKETLEEFAEKLARAFDNDNYKALMDLVIEGAKWQAERSYSKEDMRNAFDEGQALNVRGKLIQGKEWFRKIKKK